MLICLNIKYIIYHISIKLGIIHLNLLFISCYVVLHFNVSLFLLILVLRAGYLPHDGDAPHADVELQLVFLPFQLLGSRLALPFLCCYWFQVTAANQI
jgi:hypothetical protein